MSSSDFIEHYKIAVWNGKKYDLFLTTAIGDGLYHTVPLFVQRLFSLKEWSHTYYSHVGAFLANFTNEASGGDFADSVTYDKFEVTHCLKLVRYRCYWPVYSEKMRLAGRAFALYQKSESPNHFVLVNCKRHALPLKPTVHDDTHEDRPMQYTFGKPHCLYSYYAVEIQLYKLILQRHYDMVIDECWILTIPLLNPRGTYALDKVPWDSELMQYVERVAQNRRQ